MRIAFHFGKYKITSLIFLGHDSRYSSGRQISFIRRMLALTLHSMDGNAVIVSDLGANLDS